MSELNEKLKCPVCEEQLAREGTDTQGRKMYKCTNENCKLMFSEEKLSKLELNKKMAD